MKTFSSFNDTKIDSPHVSPILLVEIYLSGTTLYLCDRPFGSGSSRNVFDSQIWEPIILDWEDIKSGKSYIGNKVPEPGTGSVLIDNTVPIAGVASFTTLFSSNTVFYQNIKIYRIYEGASATADKILLVDSEIEDLEMERETIRVYYTSSEVTLNKKFSPEFCELDSYPGADPDEVGKMLPIVYGNAKKVPFIGVDTGTLDTLSGDIDDSVISFTVSDATGFPIAGGTVQIDSEQITYAYRSGNLFSGCTRGVNDTTATAHDKGAIVAEIQSAYIYVLGHPVKSIDNVYVEHRDSGEFILQTDNYTAYTGQTGDEHPTYTGKAVIQFNTLPTLAKQVNIEIEDNITVIDTIDVDDPGHVHGTTDRSAYVSFDTPVEYGGFTVFPGYLCDGSLEDATYLSSQGAYVKAGRLMGSSGTIDSGWELYTVRFVVDIRFLDSNCNVQLQFALKTGGGYVYKSHTFTETGLQYYPAIGAQAIAIGPASAGDLEESYLYTIRGGSSSGGSALVTEAWLHCKFNVYEFVAGVTKEGDVQKSGTVELTGNSTADTVIGGRVCADTQGYPADVTGNYGTSGSLIERPDYILKHFLVTHCGWSISNFGTTYTASASAYLLNDIVLAPVLLEKPVILEFLSRLAFQCHSMQFFDEGKHQLVFLAEDDTSDKTIKQARIDSDSVKIRYTPRAEIINRYIATYNKEWVQAGRSDIEDEKSVIQEDDATSQGIYGVLVGDNLDLNFVRSEAQARLLLEWLLEDTADSKLIVNFDSGDYLEALQKGDIIDFSFDAASFLDKEFLGLIVSETSKFRVLDINRSSGGVKQIEAKQSSQTVTAEYDGYIDNTRWEADQLNGVTSSSWDSDNNRWNFNISSLPNGGKIHTKGTWADAIKPEKIKITHDHGGTPSLTIYAVDGILYQTDNYTSDTEITPNWANRIGIASIQLEVAAGDNTVFHVSNIQLWSQSTTATQTTTSTCSTVSTISSSSSTASTTSTTTSTHTSTSTVTTGTTASTTVSTTTSTGTTFSTTTTCSTVSTTSSSSSTISTTSSSSSTISTTSTASTLSSTSSTQTTESGATTNSTTSSSSSTASTTSSSGSTSSTASTLSSTSTSTTASSSSTSTTAPPQFYPAANSDDGQCESDGSNFSDAWQGGVLGYFSGSGYYSYFRFTNVIIPKDATINECYIRFTANASGSGTTVSLNVYFDTAMDPAAYTSGAQVTGASLSSAVGWGPVGSWTDGAQYDTPELKTILQVLINDAGWVSGNAIIAQVRNNGGSSYRAPSMYNYSGGGEKAELHVTWS